MLRQMAGVRGKIKSAASWAADGRIYPEGVLLQESNTFKVKQSDGQRRYSELPYMWPNDQPNPISRRTVGPITISFDDVNLDTSGTPVLTLAEGDVVYGILGRIKAIFDGSVSNEMTFYADDADSGNGLVLFDSSGVSCDVINEDFPVSVFSGFYDKQLGAAEEFTIMAYIDLTDTSVGEVDLYVDVATPISST